eukprot:4900648-Amphidinium_carterae.1
MASPSAVHSRSFDEVVRGMTFILFNGQRLTRYFSFCCSSTIPVFSNRTEPFNKAAGVTPGSTRVLGGTCVSHAMNVHVLHLTLPQEAVHNASEAVVNALHKVTHPCVFKRVCARM